MDFFEGISSDCILSEYVIEQLCREMLQDAGRSFCGLLNYMIVSKRKHWKYNAFVQDNPCCNCHSIFKCISVAGKLTPRR